LLYRSLAPFRSDGGLRRKKEDVEKEIEESLFLTGPNRRTKWSQVSHQ
jgi:hypothetical protein